MAAAPSAAVEQPEERSKPSPSGRLLLRMPAQLHAELTRVAEREGVSLNQFITGTLAARIGWGDAKRETEAAGADPVDHRSRVVVVALVANAVVIGLAAIAAIAILVLAWRG